ncbi:hypothetical protein LSH36_1158g00006 [Paralvinella palmiformis]|uniref:G-protein coupled receptors family 1 profile domain-containing protein n=1 Tax=Paralvinella palmiformis TaxID=53620 RepID=A0AAD9MR58_9ANNE|nr:hypothetical protein LSH36_1158g00006 [Paralvinella palmiformis]
MDSIEKPAKLWIEYTIAILLVKYTMISLVVIGTVGNLLSFVVLMRRRMRRNSVNTYLAILSCADTVVLYISAFKTWLRVATGFELLHVSDAACKITIFVFMLASHLSAWLIVLVTANRFVAVCFPFRAVQMFTPKKSVLAVVVLICVLIAYNVHLLWTMHLHEFEYGYKQCAPRLSNDFMNGPFNYIRLASYTLVPFALVMGMNASIIVCICRTSRQTVRNADRALTRTGLLVTNTRTLQRNKQQITVMLLLVSFSWLLLTLPFAVISLINFRYSTNHGRAATFLLKTTSFLLMYLNHSCNFFLYCMVGKKFRTEFISMFCDCRRSLLEPRPSTFKGNRTRRSSHKRAGEIPLTVYNASGRTMTAL